MRGIGFDPSCRCLDSRARRIKCNFAELSFPALLHLLDEGREVEDLNLGLLRHTRPMTVEVSEEAEGARGEGHDMSIVLVSQRVKALTHPRNGFRIWSSL